MYIYNFDDNLTDLVAVSVKSTAKANISMEAYQFYLYQLPSSEVITKRTWYVTCSLKEKGDDKCMA